MPRRHLTLKPGFVRSKRYTRAGIALTGTPRVRRCSPKAANRLAGDRRRQALGSAAPEPICAEAKVSHALRGACVRFFAALSVFAIPQVAVNIREVCPWNVSFARPNRVPEFAPREVIAGKDARTLAREILAMDDEQFRTAFKDSPMKRAKLRGLRRNAAVVFGNVGAREGIKVVPPHRRRESLPPQ